MSLLRTLESNLLPIRPLAKHGTPAYGTPSAFDDDGNDFLELRAIDPYLRAKELALFARSFLKELNRYGLTFDDYLAAFLIMLTKEAITFYYNYVIKAKLLTFKANAIAKENLGTSLSECFEKLAKKLKGIQSSLRLSLKDNRSFANKLYSACKNVLKITIARMNLAFIFTAVVANIRRAIAFTTETSRPFAKASFVITHGTFNADEVYKQLEIQTAFHAFTSQIETQNVLASKAEIYIASKYFENVFIRLMIDSGAANFFTASLPQLRAL
ncbi:hypothetical protein MBM_06890 [Drepanopeziza brunnea f. sp. 'multigermtubi' MB_m1]|uniref:Uncharacterized protein n=1 Tax=Marssonina brunnea f. sp. multigermtubi (strain MB_m1) TaxID=1072389 RepID=K1XRA7_MARBU|nr:uncharacterized protein MBM_06890 [Drepanopeziza brunnea f. sp. 'multigermtubi' MB_m1]EKD15129.1 hypothetical protein MBM_06890 [Drepanopeziza brunnea f. sp. 'multigermtubi' MB_m1]